MNKINLLKTIIATAYTNCSDGTNSPFAGSGTCSWHGGVERASSSTTTWIVIIIVVIFASVTLFAWIMSKMDDLNRKSIQSKLEKYNKYNSQIVSWKNKRWKIYGTIYKENSYYFQTVATHNKMRRHIPVEDVIFQLNPEDPPSS